MNDTRRTLGAVLDEAATLTAELRRIEGVEALSADRGWVRVRRAARDVQVSFRLQLDALDREALRVAWDADRHVIDGNGSEHDGMGVGSDA